MYNLVYNSILLYVFYCSNFQFQPSEIFLFGFCVSLTYLHLYVVCLFSFLSSSPLLSSRFFTFDSARCSRLIYYIAKPVREPFTFFNELWLLLLKTVLETKIWVLCVLIAIGVSLLLGILNWQSKAMYVYKLTCGHTNTYKYFNTTIFTYIKLNMSL